MRVAQPPPMLLRRSVNLPIAAIEAAVMPPALTVRGDAPVANALTPEVIYERYLEFVWRNARRMGIGESDLEDVVQEVFVTVHRRHGGFESRSSVETWLFGILLHVVQHHRRAKARRLRRAEALVHLSADPPGPSFAGDETLELLARREQAALLQRLLDGLDDEKRAIFLLVELEQKTVPEIAATLNLNENTVYSRLRAARQSLEKAVHRMNASEKRVSK